MLLTVLALTFETETARLFGRLSGCRSAGGGCFRGFSNRGSLFRGALQTARAATALLEAANGTPDLDHRRPGINAVFFCLCFRGLFGRGSLSFDFVLPLNFWRGGG